MSFTLLTAPYKYVSINNVLTKIPVDYLAVTDIH